MEKYQQIKVLGEGSYGKAILVSRKSDKVKFVIKEVRLYGVSQQDREDALKEVAVLKALDHPFIVSYIESFNEKGNLYIVMEFADGGDLSQLIEKQGKTLLSEEKIMQLFIQLALAIKFIHDRKILHRDLKCQNVFLTKSGDVKLGDFGISKVLDSTLQMCKTQIGTPYYLSPEICEGKQYNSKTDIWSLGCILYELCTLKHAFNAANMNALIIAIIRGKYQPISSKYSLELRNLVSELLTRDTKARPSINTILQKPFIKRRMTQMLGEDVVESELDHTILHGVQPLKEKIPFARGSTPGKGSRPTTPGRQSVISQERKKADLAEIKRKKEQEEALMLRKLEEEQKAREEAIRKQALANEAERLRAARRKEIDRAEQIRMAEENLRKQEEEARRIKEEIARKDAQRRAQSKLESSPPRDNRYLLDPKEIYKRQKAEADYNRQQMRQQMNAPNPFISPDDDEDDYRQNPPPIQRKRPVSKQSPQKNYDDIPLKKPSQAEIDDAERRRIWKMDHEAAKMNRERARKDLEGFAAQAALVLPKSEFNYSDPDKRKNRLLDDDIIVSKGDGMPRPSPRNIRLLDDATIKGRKKISLDTDNDNNDDDITLPTQTIDAFRSKPKLIETNTPSRVARSALGNPNPVVMKAKEHVSAIHDQAQYIREALGLHEAPSQNDSFEDKKAPVIKRKNKEVPIPEFTGSESLFYRAEAIRAFLEEEIGIDALVQLKDYILAQRDGAYNRDPFPEDCDPQIVILTQQLIILDEALSNV